MGPEVRSDLREWRGCELMIREGHARPITAAVRKRTGASKIWRMRSRFWPIAVLWLVALGSVPLPSAAQRSTLEVATAEFERYSCGELWVKRNSIFEADDVAGVEKPAAPSELVISCNTVNKRSSARGLCGQFA
jgi:hypothetical protein